MLADLSSQGDTPGRWAARVVSAFRRFEANRVVAEINNGGEMVEAVLRQSDANLPVRNVTATRGKYLRAEPVAAAYERGIVFHVGAFEKLEDQLCALTPDFDSRAAGFSPDRADALVWAVADLLGFDGASGMMAFGGGGDAAAHPERLAPSHPPSRAKRHAIQLRDRCGRVGSRRCARDDGPR